MANKFHQFSTCEGIQSSTRHMVKSHQQGILWYLAWTYGKYINIVQKSETTIKGHLTHIMKHALSTTTDRNGGYNHILPDTIQ